MGAATRAGVIRVSPFRVRYHTVVLYCTMEAGWWAALVRSARLDASGKTSACLARGMTPAQTPVDLSRSVPRVGLARRVGVDTTNPPVPRQRRLHVR